MDQHPVFDLDRRQAGRDFAAYFAELEQRITALERGNPLTAAALDGGAIEVYDGDGSLQAIVGEQSDGSTGVIEVNGPPPPQPEAPTLAPALGGVAVSWAGTWTDADAAPLDYARVEIHTATSETFEPSPDTLVGTMESPRGGTLVVPTDHPVFVRLLARTRSGTGGEPSAAAGPQGGAAVVADEVLDGIINEAALAEEAVTRAKIALEAVGPTQIADDAVTTPKVLAGAIITAHLNALAVTAEKIAALAITTPKLAALAVTADKIAANSVTAEKILAGSITAAHVKVGSLTADRLSVIGGTNLLPDPSFEGAAGAALVAEQTYWSIAPTGLDSAYSAQLNCAAPSPVIRSLTLVTFPISGGQQVYIATDLRPSPDFNGAGVRTYLRWRDAAGTATFHNVETTVAPRGEWSRISGTGTAPTGTVTAEVVIGVRDASTGTVLFDNVVAQPVMSRVQIADGAITAEKIDADAINGKMITGATLRTAAAGNRVVVNSTNGRGLVRFYDDTNQLTAEMSATGDPDSGMQSLLIRGPDPDGVFWTERPYLSMAANGRTSTMTLRAHALTIGHPIPAFGEASPVPVTVNGVLTARNIEAGRVSITPRPNVPTSVTVTGLRVLGNSIRGIATPSTTVPGTIVTGVGITDITSRSCTIWLTRTNDTTTAIDYLLIGS
ncbi:hypothetical protein ACIQWY_29625 [Streptomyces albidoflavus]